MAQRRTSGRERLAGRFGFRTGWPHAAGVVAIVLVVGLIAFWSSCSKGSFEIVGRDGSPANPPSATEAASMEASAPSPTPAQSESHAVVHVDGAVASPGVYELVGDPCRVCDAIDMAGGLSEDADTTTLNLASVVTDGSKVHVPRRGEEATSVASVSSEAAGSVSSAESAGPININTATAEQLDALPGVGEATAAAIVEDREANGPFSSLEDLMRVSGIGEKRFAKLKGQICV